MNITNENPTMVFRKDGQYGAMYSLGLSKKTQEGKYENAYIPCKFKKDVNVENKTNIYIKNAWLSFYKNKEGKDVFYIFINEFTTMDQTIDDSKEIKKDNDVYEEFSSVTESLELPF